MGLGSVSTLLSGVVSGAIGLVLGASG